MIVKIKLPLHCLVRLCCLGLWPRILGFCNFIGYFWVFVHGACWRSFIWVAIPLWYALRVWWFWSTKVLLCIIIGRTYGGRIRVVGQLSLGIPPKKKKKKTLTFSPKKKTSEIMASLYSPRRLSSKRLATRSSNIKFARKWSSHSHSFVSRWSFVPRSCEAWSYEFENSIIFEWKSQAWFEQYIKKKDIMCICLNALYRQGVSRLYFTSLKWYSLAIMSAGVHRCPSLSVQISPFFSIQECCF